MKHLLLFLIASFLFSGYEASPKLLQQILRAESIPAADQLIPSANEDSPVHEGRKSCPSGWQSFQGSCYFIQTSKISSLTFEGAQAKCESIYAGSSLVALETIEETNFIKQYLQQHRSSFTSHTENGWMTSGNKVDGVWTWKVTGAPVNTAAFHWGPSQPDSQRCLSFWPSYQYDMADVDCGSYSRQMVCEI